MSSFLNAANMAPRKDESLEAYIHRQIPITAHMGVQIIEATPRRVELSAPLAPNINHRETVFGGSAAAVATLAAWTLVLVRLREAEIRGRLVIARNSMEYQKPITDDFTAVSKFESEADWNRFVAGITRKGRGRFRQTATLFLDGESVADFQGDFVSLKLSS